MIDLRAQPAKGSDGVLSSPALLERARAETEAAQGLTARPLTRPPQALRDDQRLPGFGRPVPGAVRALAETRLGADLSGVRLHSDAEAQEALSAHKARAFTRGSQIAIGPRDAEADTAESAALMAHELGHAAQQAQPGGAPVVQREGDSDSGIGRAPPEAAFAVEQGIGDEDNHALFDHDSATLTPAARTALSSAAQGYPAGMRVTIHGYASLEGGDSYNLNLSAHRAVAIRDHLREVMPAGTVFVLVAHGETDAFGETGENRRGGVDFFDLTLSAPNMLELPAVGGARVGRPSLLDEDMRLTLPPLDFGVSPDPEPQPDLSHINLFPPLSEPEVYGPRLPDPPQVAPLWLRPPPSVFTDGFDWGPSAREFSARGIPLTPRDAQALEAHFDYWRLRFFQWGLSPDQATWAAQLGTDIAASTEAGLEAPYRHEVFDRRFGTEPPPTLTIMNPAIASWLGERMVDLYEAIKGEDDK